MKIISFTAILLILLTAIACGQSRIDSFKNLLTDSRIDDSLRIKYNLKIASIYSTSNKDSSLLYFEKGISIIEKNKVVKKYVGIYNNFAGFEAELGMHESALRHIDTAIKYYPKSNVEQPLSIKAGIYLSIGKYEQAAETYITSLQADKNADEGKPFMTYNNLVIVFNRIGNFERSFFYCKKQYDLAVKWNDDIEIFWACINYFETYQLTNKIDEARPYVLKAYEIAKHSSDLSMKATASNNMGILALNDKVYDKAVKFYSEAVILFQKTGERVNLCNTLNNMGMAYTQLKDIGKAQEYLGKALSIAEELSLPVQAADSYKLLSDNYAMAGSYKMAYDYQMKHKRLSDSLLNERSRNQIFNMEAKYQSEEKEERIKLLNKEQQLQLLKSKEQGNVISRQKIIRNMLFLISALGILTLLLLLHRYRDTQKRKIVEERERISRDLHDQIGSSLGSIANFSELVKMKVGKRIGPSERMLFEKIETTSRETIGNMSDIVWTINPRNDTLEQLVNRMESVTADLLSAKGIDYDFDVNGIIDNVKLSMKQRKNIFLAFKEALHNIVKHSESDTVSVSVHVKDRKINLAVTDNGVGFNPENYIKTIGNGLYNMLALAKEVKGKVLIQSTVMEGATVQFTFPVNI